MSEIITMVNDALIGWQDQVLKHPDMMDPSEVEKTIAWVNSLLCQTKAQSRKKKEYCEICGTLRSLLGLKGHHLAGRTHCHITITVCPQCHDQLSIWQYKRDARWWLSRQPDHVRQAFLLFGLAEAFELKATKPGQEAYAKLAYGLIRKGTGRLLDDLG